MLNALLKLGASKAPSSSALSAKLAMSVRLAEQVGIGNIRSGSKWGKLLAVQRTARGVGRTAEFQRIEALPRRKWETDASILEATAALNAWLRTQGGSMTLWPNQAAALIEAATMFGLFGPIGVGRGKALITLLVPVVMAAERPVLFVPAQLRDQTNRWVIPEMRKHWRMHPGLRVHGYSELSIAKNKRMLFELEPDLIVLDECHNVKNAQAARVKRLREYLKERPATRVVALSGTVTRRSIRDYWQIALWCLKPDYCPLPSTWHEMVEWADALDEGVLEPDRVAPGALERLCVEGENVRAGYGRRLVETPGVVATATHELGVSIRVSERRVIVPPRVFGELARMRQTWVTPYGDEITEAVELWRHARELACGFYYRWDPAPPSDWLEARKAWKKLVRDTLKYNRQGLDSELLVSRDFARRAKVGEESKEIETYAEWELVKHTFEPNSVAEWLSDFALDDAAEWLHDKKEPPGIAWTEHVAFAERLAAHAGIVYFGAGMKASAAIADARGPFIASMRSHGEGKNLQRYSRNLMTAAPSSGKAWEQVMGRTHREGQDADECVFDTWMHCDELRASLAQAVADARYIQETTKAHQKLCYCDMDLTIPLANTAARSSL